MVLILRETPEDNLKIMVRLRKLLEWALAHENVQRIQLRDKKSKKKATFLEKWEQ